MPYYTLLVIYIAPCVYGGSTLYINIFTVRVTGLLYILTAILYNLFMPTAIPPIYHVHNPIARGCPYSVYMRVKRRSTL